MMNNKDKLTVYTAKELAELLKVSVQTIRKYGTDGTIGTYQPGGKNCSIRYYLKEEASLC